MDSWWLPSSESSPCLVACCSAATCCPTDPLLIGVNIASCSICVRCSLEVALVRHRTHGFGVAAAAFCAAGGSGDAGASESSGKGSGLAAVLATGSFLNR